MYFSSIDDAYNYLIKKSLEEGISKRQLALKCGVSPQQMSNALRRGKIKYSSLEKVAKELGHETKICLTNKI